MGDNSKIHWLFGGASWNPIMGCDKASAGCQSCYALDMIDRFQGRKGFPKSKTCVELFPKRMDQPIRWKKPRRIFVSSMGDLFHDAIPFAYLKQVYKTMLEADQHTYIILTKRPQRMKDFIQGLDFDIPPHMWHGVSVENTDFLWRMDILREIPVIHRFVSFEPLIGDLRLYWTDLAGMDWVIVGGESGNKARPMLEEWVKGILEQVEWMKERYVRAPGVFMKQMGTHWAKNNGSKSEKGDLMEEWPVESRIREDLVPRK